jgi:hypothetical protein
MSRKDTTEATSSYVELSSQAYSLFVDAYASANQRALGYWKSLWEIASRPYASTAVETTVRENFDRANQIVGLTISELQAGGSKAAELTEKFAAHNAKIQDSASHAFRGAVNTGISNMNFVKDTTQQQFEDMSKRLDEIQTRAAASVSQN